MSLAGSPYLRVLGAVFAGTLTVQAIAVLRQIAIAGAFGVGREVDIYMLVLALATMSVLALAAIFDTAAIPRLIRAREEGGAEAVRALAALYLLAVLLLAPLAAIAFRFLLPLVLPVVAAGFDASERARAAEVATAFMPWAILALWQYALGALHKARGAIRRVLAAEMLAAAVSCALILLWHPNVEAIALAYGAGYAVGVVSLLPGLGVRPRWTELGRPAGLGGLLRQVGGLFAASQVAAVGGLAERAFQTLLQPGALSAWAYAGLVTNNASALLAFRDVFIVPLSVERDRAARLERVLCGLVLLAVPAAGFLAVAAEPLVRLLFERGRFGPEAVALTAFFLSWQAFVLPGAALTAPVLRMFQVIDRVSLTMAVYAGASAGILVLGGVLVVWLGLGAWGFGLAMVLNGWWTSALACALLHRAGLRPRWSRVAGYAAYAAVLSAAGAALAQAAGQGLPPLLGLPTMGVAYALPVALGYTVIRRRLRAIVRGASGQP